MEKPVAKPKDDQSPHPRVCLVIHGGAGGITRDIMAKAGATSLVRKYEDKLREALEKGYSVLSHGGSSLDAVEAAINTMESSTLFDAGKGAVVNVDGEPEMDASIMEGTNKRAGAVTGVRTIKHPITLARKVMESTPHVMLFGEGADSFGKASGLETVTKEYFFEEPRYWELLERIYGGDPLKPDERAALKGTVGAVALDKSGCISAGTSTGGTLHKMKGRIGDSPIIGAGTYADSAFCGVSCTGCGEYFIRGAVAHTVVALCEYKGMSVAEAAKTALKTKVEALGGEGGIIALDREGNVAVEHNTPGMFRGVIAFDGVAHVTF